MKLFSNIPETEKQSKWFQMWLPIINQRSLCPNAQECDLFVTLSSDDGAHNWKTLKIFTETALKNASKASKIFSRVSKQLKPDAFDQDEIIQEMLAELNAILCLTLMGVEELVYHREDSVDFTGKIRNVAWGIEVSI